jgi:hypothetical protein
MNRRILLALLFALVPLTHQVFAHHNMTAIFDFNDRVTITGTLSKVDWRNPHIYLTVDVKNAAGAMETWQAEGPSPTWFRIRDIGKDDFGSNIGKSFNIELSRARDKTPMGLIRTITLPGGRVVSACPQNC